jgi:5-methylcytosine-specific restriction enzyme subunit McrC
MQIPIQNIYFLLCYAWNKLEESDVVNVAAIDTTELVDLFAKILTNYTAKLLKQGLDRNYIENEHIVSGIKGKLNLTASIKRNILSMSRTVCTYDEFDYDILHNQILKTTMSKLLRTKNLDKQLKDDLHKVFIKLPPISEIQIRAAHFKQIRLHRNNYHYDFILKVCQIVNDNLFIDESSGTYKFKDFLREERMMAKLFESFVKNFYKIELHSFIVSGEVINWAFISENIADLEMLPQMETDISLLSENRKIIIDTKYYKEAFNKRYEKDKIKSENLYQLFSYLKNQESDTQVTKTCDGILLYPAIDNDFDYEYQHQEHKIRIRSLNLNQDWQLIRSDLLELVK